MTFNPYEAKYNLDIMTSDTIQARLTQSDKLWHNVIQRWIILAAFLAAAFEVFTSRKSSHLSNKLKGVNTEDAQSTKLIY